jgi:hypothetical protein
MKRAADRPLLFGLFGRRDDAALGERRAHCGRFRTSGAHCGPHLVGPAAIGEQGCRPFSEVKRWVWPVLVVHVSKPPSFLTRVKKSI